MVSLSLARLGDFFFFFFYFNFISHLSSPLFISLCDLFCSLIGCHHTDYLFIYGTDFNFPWIVFHCDSKPIGVIVMGSFITNLTQARTMQGNQSEELSTSG